MAKFQTLTYDEQTDILDHLDKAREILKNNRGDNDEKQRLIDEITTVFHSIQLANTQEL